MDIWQILVIVYFCVMIPIGWCRTVLKTIEDRRDEGKSTDTGDLALLLMLSVPICLVLFCPLPLMLWLGGFWNHHG